jgi:hypothetical protein
MALNVVTLQGSYEDGGENQPSGWLQFVPSAALTDADDHLLVRQEPVTVPLSSGAFSVELTATDNADLQPPGWYWTVTEYLQGLPPSQPWNFYLAFSGGATQDISALSPAAV